MLSPLLNLHLSNFRVRRMKVLTALNWLRKNNPIYRDVVIDEMRINALPVDSMVSGFKEILVEDEESSILDDRGPLPDSNVNEELSSFIPFNVNTKKQKDLINEQANTHDLEFIGDIPYNEFRTEHNRCNVFSNIISGWQR